MKTCLYSLLFILVSAQFSAQAISHRANNFQTGDNEGVILAKVNAIPEVKKYLHEHANISPSVIIARPPIPGFNYYLVKVGMGTDPKKFQATYNFCVTPKTFQVLYLDIMTEDLDPKNAVITLEQWRQFRSTIQFQKMHTYHNGKIVVMNGQ